jgi:Ca-activated chloride channel homolog
MSNRRRHSDRRHGAIHILVVFGSMAVLSIGALAINVAYIQLTMTEMRMAADSASKAAMIELSRSQSLAQASSAAVRVAGRHQVAGQALRITAGDIEFGRCERVGDRFVVRPIQANTDSVHSARVSPTLGANGRPLLAFQRILLSERFNVSANVTAAKFDHDICLVLDRSGSMAWDLSNKEFSYPGRGQKLPRLENMIIPPHQKQSRWAALRSGVADFIAVLDARPIKPHLAMVSYASYYEFGDHRVQEVTVDVPLGLNYANIQKVLAEYSSKPIMGGTNIRLGLIMARRQLLGSPWRRITAQRSIVLFSDGLYTDSTDPRTVISDLKANDITVHTISLSSQADQALMRELAEQTGGTHVHADSSTDLRRAFRTIAESLPTILIQ